jgi:hypothetical protein
VALSHRRTDPSPLPEATTRGVGREGHSGDARARGGRLAFLSGCRLPQVYAVVAAAALVDRLVPAPGSQRLAVRREGNRKNLGMRPEPPDLLAAGNLPQADRAVPPAGGHAFAFRRKSDRVDEGCVPLETPQLPAGRHVPEPQRPVLAPRKERPAVRREGDRIYRVPVTAEATHLSSRRRVP